MYFSENGLGLRAFQSLAKFESEVVAMALGLLHGGPDARGAMTTGGTESIFLAVKAARDAAAEQRPARTGDAADRAAVQRPPGVRQGRALPRLRDRARRRSAPTSAPTRRRWQRRSSDDTVMIVGSAPAYPHGVMDPIAEIAARRAERGIWMHVDACVGGYIAPFAQQLGAPVAAFDFAVPGVTSISADLHKYGYARRAHRRCSSPTRRASRTWPIASTTGRAAST